MSARVSEATCCRSARALSRSYLQSLALTVVRRFDHLCHISLESRNEVLVSGGVLVEACEDRLCLGSEVGLLGHCDELDQENARILFSQHNRPLDCRLRAQAPH